MHYSSLPQHKIFGIILTLLGKEEKMHGYKLTQRFKEIVQRPVKEGVLYPALHYLEADGMLIAETQYMGRRTRKYYSLSAKAQRQQKILNK